MILHTIIPPEQIFPGDAPRGGECRRMHNKFYTGRKYEWSIYYFAADLHRSKNVS